MNTSENDIFSITKEYGYGKKIIKKCCVLNLTCY